MPTGEFERITIPANSQISLDLSALSVAPSGAMITYYQANGSNAWVGVELSGGTNGYSVVLIYSETLLIENVNTLEVLSLTNKTASSQSVEVTYLKPVAS